MLIATTNWRITDGTLAAGPAAGLVHRWRIGTRLTILRAGFRRDGGYRPVDAVDLVFAGDTFDWLVSSEWLGETRPWHGGTRAADVLQRVVDRSFRRGGRLLATLASWSRRGVEVPGVDRHGRPSPGTGRRVPVRVTVLSGDRDERLEDVVGRWGTERGIGVGRIWSTKEVSIRHGHEFDPLCDTAYGRPTLAESLAVDLIARFAAEAAANADLGAWTPALVRSLSGGSPACAASRLARWLLGRRDGPAAGTSARRTLIDTWNRRVLAWHRIARRLPPRGEAGVDLVDCLAASLELEPAGLRPPARSHARSAGAAPARAAGAVTIVGHAALRDGISGPSPSFRPAGVRALPVLGAEADHEPTARVVTIDRGACVLEALPTGPQGWPESGAGGDDDRGVWISGGSGGFRGIVDAA